MGRTNIVGLKWVMAIAIAVALIHCSICAQAQEIQRVYEVQPTILHPSVYQNPNSQDIGIKGRFVRLDDKQIGVKIEGYNRTVPLVVQFTSVFSDSASSPIENPNSPLPVTIAATLKDSLVGDAGQIGIVNPGDTLRYIVSITNSGTTDATGMNFSDLLDTSTVPVGSLKATPVAVNDAYVGTYNATLNVSASGVLTNDYGVPAPTATPIAAGVTPHGTVTPSANASRHVGTTSCPQMGDCMHLPPGIY